MPAARGGGGMADMFTPEMVQMASGMMSSMTPEDMAAMSRMAGGMGAVGEPPGGIEGAREGCTMGTDWWTSFDAGSRILDAACWVGANTPISCTMDAVVPLPHPLCRCHIRGFP